MYYYKYLQLLFIAVLISSCGRDSRDHDHAHEEVDNLQIIEYSDDLELFAEVSPLVKDAKSTLLVHRITSYNVCYTKLLRFDFQYCLIPSLSESSLSIFILLAYGHFFIRTSTR